MRSVLLSTAAIFSASTRPENTPPAASETASCSSVSLKSIRIPFLRQWLRRAGTNTGSDSSSS